MPPPVRADRLGDSPGAAEPRWILATERLGFRAWDEPDFELAWALWGDERVTRFIGGPLACRAVFAGHHPGNAESARLLRRL